MVIRQQIDSSLTLRMTIVGAAQSSPSSRLKIAQQLDNQAVALVPRAGSENPETTPFAICKITSELAI